jgi:hypothetical protein
MFHGRRRVFDQDSFFLPIPPQGDRQLIARFAAAHELNELRVGTRRHVLDLEDYISRQDPASLTVSPGSDAKHDKFALLRTKYDAELRPSHQLSRRAGWKTNRNEAGDCESSSDEFKSHAASS